MTESLATKSQVMKSKLGIKITESLEIKREIYFEFSCWDSVTLSVRKLSIRLHENVKQYFCLKYSNRLITDGLRDLAVFIKLINKTFCKITFLETGIHKTNFTRIGCNFAQKI